MSARPQGPSSALEPIQTIIKTFVALSLHEREAICDTLIALTCSFLGFERGLVLLREEPTDALAVAARYGLEEADDPLLTDAAARATWAGLLDDRGATLVDAEALRARWPAPPEALAEGFAAVSVDIEDRAVGLIVVARKCSGAAIDEGDRELLAVLGGLAALFIAHGDATRAQQRLLVEVERQAEAARREAEDKHRTLEELDAQLLLVEQQRLELRELSTPILAVWERILVVPMVGHLDPRRSVELMHDLLAELVRRHARFAILDVTGIHVVDTETANYLLKIVRATGLLGARCVLTGIRPAVARTLTTVGVDLSAIVTRANLQRGLEHCIEELEAAATRTRVLTSS